MDRTRKGQINLFVYGDKHWPYGDRHHFVPYPHGRTPNSCVRCGRLKDHPVHFLTESESA
jgi:hypothetical protein